VTDKIVKAPDPCLARVHESGPAAARRWRLVAVFATLLTPASARADPLTCAQFKLRLDRAIHDMGALVAAPGPLKPSYVGGEAGKRFDWDGITGLAGTMTCGPSDAFEDFGIAIEESYRTSDDLPLVLDRFMELASASVCALADGEAKDCRALIKTMTVGSLGQFKAAMAKGEAMPTGTRDFFIVDGVDAELDMTPVGINWSIGPGLAMTTDALKKPLKPRNLDE
jgi:hypothetical protein